jgi:hypothetical protein
VPAAEESVDESSDEEPAPVEWLENEHRWLNQRVARRVEDAGSASGFESSEGTITKWSRSPPLWFMWHDSGTEEQLNNAEVRHK